MNAAVAYHPLSPYSQWPSALHNFTSPTKPNFSQASEALPLFEDSKKEEAVVAWCKQYSLGADEHAVLSKLDFKPGDNLENITDGMWTTAGALPMCQFQILATYNASIPPQA